MKKVLRRAWLLPLVFGLLVFALSASRARMHTPAPTLLLRDRQDRFLGEIAAPEGRGYWPLEVLPSRVVAATLALEDHRFYQHPGVDPIAVARAIRQNFAAGTTLSGASTLAMQVARMQAPGPRTLPRKLVEAGTALLLTARYGREAILTQYLTLAPYGNDIHGIAYAARRYLDKPVADLSWAETAFLCALPQAPSRTNPFDARGRARGVERAHRILLHLRAEGLLDDAELALAQDELGHLRVPEKGRRPEEALHVVLRLGEALGTDVLGAPLVVTTLDLPLQRRVTAIVNEKLTEWADRGARNAAVMVVDRASWEVRVAVGSADYADRARAGAIDYTRTPRSPGSTLKPFIYALALERGVTGPATVLDDLGRGPDAIENADGAALGPMLPRQALANSRNVPAVELLSRLGLGEGYAHLGELGLHKDEQPAGYYGLGLAIGGLPTRLDALLGAYTTLAGDGRLHTLRWVSGAPTEVAPRIYAASTAQLLTLHLADPMARLPSFPRMGASEYPFPVAVKTGTSADYRDAWTVAWSTDWLVGVWVGDATAEPMAHLGGFTSAAELTQEVLLELQPGRDGFSDLSFPAPTGWTDARVCPLSGALAAGACPRAVTEWFAPERSPADPCPVHQRLAVDTRDGSLATSTTPARATRIETFVELPARYAAWQAKVGLPRPPTPRAGGSAQALRSEAPVVHVTAPRTGDHLLRDPESPDGTLALEATVDPPVAQLLWYVDGQPFALVDPPYTARWPLAPGEHRFEARVPATPIVSNVVRVTAQ